MLSTSECHDYLSQHRLGRVGVSIGALPVILPVLYLFRDGSIWFFTEDGTKLNAAVTNSVVAFEVDHLDEDGGWSVLVIGRCQPERDPGVIDALHRDGLAAGAPGVREQLVQIPIHQLSGRAFSVREKAEANLGYA